MVVKVKTCDVEANVGDTVYWKTMVECRDGKVVKVTAKTAQVYFPADDYNEEVTISLRRLFPAFGQLKGKFNQFNLESK